MIIQCQESLNELLRKADRCEEVLIDLETNGDNWVHNTITGIAVYLPQLDESFYIPCNHDNAINLGHENIYLLQPLITDKIIINHNLKFDRLFMQKAGIKWNPKQSICSMMSLQLMNENEDNYKLKESCDRYGLGAGSLQESILREKLLARGYRDTKKNNWKTYMHVLSPEDVAPYAEDDTKLSYLLWKFTKSKLEELGMMNLFWKDMKFWDIICRAEFRGLLVDEKLCNERIIQCTENMESIQNQICSILDVDTFNPNSAPQVCKALGVTSSKKDELNLLSHPIAKLIVQYREWAKARNSYYQAFIELADENMYLHCSIWADGTVTARLRVSRPNLQAMPRTNDQHREKDVFIAEPGRRLIFGDWEQMELRVGAHFAREERMIDAFLHDRDPHGETAMLIYGEITPETRNGVIGGKRCNFAIVYGIGVKGLHEDTKMPIEKCRWVLNKLKQAYPKFSVLYSQAELVAKMRGHIKYYSGRLRRFPNKNECYKAMNHLIQGTVAEIARDTMIRIDEEIIKPNNEEIYFYGIPQIHDEIILNSPLELITETVPKMKGIMEDWEYIGGEKMLVPIKADLSVADSWGRKVGYEKWLKSQ